MHADYRASLFAGVLDVEKAVWIDKTKTEETAVVFNCDLLRACCIVDIARKQCKEAFVVRAYLSRTNGETWSRIPYDAVLVVKENGQPSLNPVWFKPEVKLLPVEPPPVEAFTWE